MKLSSWVAIAIAIGVVVIALGGWLAMRNGGQGLAALGGGQLIPADSYRVVDADTIAVTGTTGQGQWTRITNVIETDSDVRIAIRSLRGPGTYADVGYPIVWTVDLARPLGDRVVQDGFHEVPRREDG